jgi:hypothetical protein
LDAETIVWLEDFLMDFPRQTLPWYGFYPRGRHRLWKSKDLLG